ncbi:MAG: response regulator, partial [Myxococcota bacterium]
MPSVLIVDDDRFTRSVLQNAFADDELCARLDLSIYTANDGGQGLAAFLNLRPDVVITDLLMPNVDGWELCRAIRSESSGQHVHLIAMSGNRDPEIAQTLQTELEATYFTKPYQLRDMTRHVVQLLEMDARGEDSRQIKVVRAPRAARASQGQLAQRSLPAVLFDFLEARATGRLTLKRGRIIKTVDLIVGHPLSVTSTARDETLGHFLVAFGAITADQHKQAVRRAAAKKEKVSDSLIAMGFVSPEDMISQLTMHTCYRLTQSLRWPDGVWQFQPKSDLAVGLRGNP